MGDFLFDHVMPWVLGILLALSLGALGFAIYEIFQGGMDGFHCIQSHTECSKGCYDVCDVYVRNGVKLQ